MLYEEMTTGAVVAGYEVGTNGELTGAQAEEIESALGELNEEYGQKIRLIVPGDSATDHALDPEMPLYAFDVIFGVPAVFAEAWDCPAEVSAERVTSALEAVGEAPAEYWEKLSKKVPLLAEFTPDQPQTYLTCFGPLPYACLSAGVPHPSDDRDNTVYDFHSVQDMNQRWLDEGVDGVRIGSVEFAGIDTVDLSQEAVEDWLSKADQLDDPKIYMTVRYD